MRGVHAAITVRMSSGMVPWLRAELQTGIVSPKLLGTCRHLRLPHWQSRPDVPSLAATANLNASIATAVVTGRRSRKFSNSAGHHLGCDHPNSGRTRSAYMPVADDCAITRVFDAVLFGTNTACLNVLTVVPALCSDDPHSPAELKSGVTSQPTNCSAGYSGTRFCFSSLVLLPMRMPCWVI